MKLRVLISRWLLVLAVVLMPLQGGYAMAADGHGTGDQIFAMSAGDDCHHAAADSTHSPGDHIQYSTHCATAGHCCAAIDFSNLWAGKLQPDQFNRIAGHTYVPIVLPLETKPPRIL